MYFFSFLSSFVYLCSLSWLLKGTLWQQLPFIIILGDLCAQND